MKAALLYGIGDLRLVDIPKPEYGPDEVLTKVTVCAVCPTDIRKYRVGNGGVLQFPFNMGHEWVGEVVEVGANVKDVQIGDRILGGGYAGYAEYAPLGGHALRPVKGEKLVIPEGVSDEEATFVEPLADAIHSITDQAKADAIRERSNSTDFDFIADHTGMFSLLGLPEDVVQRLKAEDGIYMINDSRINIAGLPEDRMGEVADKLLAAMR